MNREDIIKLAREAGFVIDEASRQYQPKCIGFTHYLIDDELERFAALVAAAKEQEMLERIRHIIVQAEERGAAAEREACAAICDRFQARDVGMQPAECAGAIRARGQA